MVQDEGSKEDWMSIAIHGEDLVRSINRTIMLKHYAVEAVVRTKAALMCTVSSAQNSSTSLKPK